MARKSQPRSQAGAISLLGIPYDANSSYLHGAALAPSKIREALYCDSSNLWTEDGLELTPDRIHDVGDLKLSPHPAIAADEITAAVRRQLAKGHPLIFLGGDHSITYPIVHAFHECYRQLTILHFDAHPDLYDNFADNPHSHASPFARIMENKLAKRLVQVGIRTMSGHQREQAKRFGVEVISMRNLASFRKLKLTGPLYVTFDMDVLDPAFAPGVSHHEPGGMSVREALTFIQSLKVEFVGADIVEYNPARDLGAQTAMVTAKILKELAARMLRDPHKHWV